MGKGRSFQKKNFTPPPCQTPNFSVTFCISLICILFFSCTAPPPASNKPRVLTSTPPYQYFVERIVQDSLEVQSIVPPGADSHTFEPTPRQRASLEQGVLWFQIGEPFEKSLSKISQNSLQRVDLCQGISASSDRHFWMSPKLASRQVSLIAQALCEKFPEQKAFFEANEAALQQEFATLDEELAHSLAAARGKTLLVSHPSFGYFCSDYSLTQLSIEEEGKEARPKHLESLLRDAEQKRGSLVLIALPQHNNKGVQMMGSRFNLPIKEIDPYTYHYFSMMHALSDWVARDCD